MEASSVGEQPAAGTWRLACQPVASFSSLALAKEAVNAVARANGYALVTTRSNANASKTKLLVTLACDRHGKPTPYQPKPGVKRRQGRATRKCECPMRIHIVKDTSSEEWKIEHRGNESTHNHQPSRTPMSHPVHRRSDLTPEITQEILADARTGVKPAQTLARLVQKNPDISLIVEDIYNAKRRAEDEILQGKSRMEFVLGELSTDQFFSANQVDSTNRLTHLFLAYEPAIDIYKANPDVLLMDCTYKTNYFKMPLLNIVGVTGMNTTIHVAQAFLRAEKQPDYRFAVDQLKLMMSQFHIPLPQLILVDCEVALLKILENVFPNVPVLLCIWHVEKNIQKHARRGAFPQVRDDEASTSQREIRKDSDEHSAWCDAVRDVINAKTEDEYESRRELLRTLSKFETEYVDNTWLSIWKCNVVHCWTNKAVHFGLQATSRVEGYHSALKKWLVNSEGDLFTIFHRMKSWWQLSIRKHEQAISDSIIKSIRILESNLFRDVNGVIHANALRVCLEQTRRIRQGNCTGVFMHTMGMPCIHKLRETETRNEVLKPSDFHAHWWIERDNAEPARAPVVIDPLRIADRRSARANEKAAKKRKHTRGSGVTGTRRDPSGFELQTEMPSLSAALARTQDTPYNIATITQNP